MLSRLTQGPVSVTVLAGPTGMALPTVLRHLSVLEASGLIATEKTGRTRICRCLPDAFDQAEAWLQDQRQVWEARLDRLQALVETRDAAPPP